MSPSNPNAGTKIAEAKRVVISEVAARSNYLRLKIVDANPIGFLISVVKGEAFDQVVEDKDGNERTIKRAASLSTRTETAKFLSNKVVGNIAPQQMDTGAEDNNPAMWTKFFDELPETQDVDVTVDVDVTGNSDGTAEAEDMEAQDVETENDHGDNYPDGEV